MLRFRKVCFEGVKGFPIFDNTYHTQFIRLVKISAGFCHFIMPAPAHIQADTLDRFIAGWKKWTPEDVMATWSSDCVQVMLPLSLGVPPKSISEVKKVLPKLMAILKNYEV